MSTSDQSIIEFLTVNPDFLVRHPALLRHLSIPHGLQGNAVSLLEVQAKLLRERVSELEQHFLAVSLKSTAHRALSKNLKSLVPRLYDCNGEHQLFEILEEFLADSFTASTIRIYAAAYSEKIPNPASQYLRPLDEWRRGLFTLILNNLKPLCDSLQHEHLVALFGNEAENVYSSLLIPFYYQDQEALLAIGSHEWQRYEQSVELDLLLTVIEVFSRLTTPSFA